MSVHMLWLTEFREHALEPDCRRSELHNTSAGAELGSSQRAVDGS